MKDSIEIIIDDFKGKLGEYESPYEMPLFQIAFDGEFATCRFEDDIIKIYAEKLIQLNGKKVNTQILNEPSLYSSTITSINLLTELKNKGHLR